MQTYKFTLISMALCLIAFPVAAQEYNTTLEAINQMNDIKPLQNPGYERADEILKRRVLDQKNKVVGDIRDIVVKENGSIDQLRVDFNRLNLGNEVFVDYRDLNARPTSNGYTIGFSSDQIKTLYPEFLANIDTAAGDDAETFSLRKMLGSPVVALDGRKLGVIEDVLFSSNGARAEALYVSMQISNLRGRSIAIPIGMAKMENTSIGQRFVVRDDQADAMVDYAEKK